MSSSSKKRQTMAKMTRERAVKEKRAQKQERKDERKLAAAAGTADVVGDTLPGDTPDDETPGGSAAEAEPEAGEPRQQVG